jgi:hypothetical protein
MSELDDDLSVDINLRPVHEVGERMLILAALIRIALVESEDEDEIDPAEAAAELNDLRDALRVRPWATGLTEEELSFVQRAGGRLSETDVLEMMWRMEALSALSWAVGDVDLLPPPWRPSSPEQLTARIPAPWEEVDQYIGGLTLREEDEIAAERERNELWAWRGAIHDDLNSLRGKDRVELEEALDETVEEAVEAQLIDSANGDFAVNGRPYPQADPETRALIAEVSLQRLHALNWLCGFGDSWDDVPLDV